MTGAAGGRLSTETVTTAEPAFARAVLGGSRDGIRSLDKRYDGGKVQSRERRSNAVYQDRGNRFAYGAGHRRQFSFQERAAEGAVMVTTGARVSSTTTAALDWLLALPIASAATAVKVFVPSCRFTFARLNVPCASAVVVPISCDAPPRGRRRPLSSSLPRRCRRSSSLPRWWAGGRYEDRRIGRGGIERDGYVR